MSHIREKAIQGLQPGDRFTVTRTLSEADTLCFADLTGDYNPIHFDPRFVRVKNFKAPIVHGLLAASLITEIGGQIGWLASGMDFRFKRPVYLGDRIECAFTLTELAENGRAQAEAVYTNQNGEEVLRATLYGFVPGERERSVMAAMVAEGDPSNRLAVLPLPEKAQQVQNALREQGLACRVVVLPDSTRTARDAAQAVGCQVDQIAKSLVFQGKESQTPVLAVVSGANRADEQRIGAWLCEPVKMAKPAFAREQTGYAIGGVPPFAHAHRLLTLLDADLFRHPFIWAAAGTPNALFRLTPRELLLITDGRIAELKS